MSARLTQHLDKRSRTDGEFISGDHTIDFQVIVVIRQDPACHAILGICQRQRSLISFAKMH